MKKLFFLCALAASVMTIASCSKNETYSDQLDRENDAINAYIVKISLVKSSLLSKITPPIQLKINMYSLIIVAFICKFWKKGQGLP